VPFELVIVTPHREVYRDRVDSVVLPGAEGVYNPTRGEWERTGGLSRIPYLGRGGFLASVTSSSKHATAAFDLLRRLTGKEWSVQDVTVPVSRIGPYRSSHLDTPDAWVERGLSLEDAAAYVSAVRTSLSDRQAPADLRIRGSLEYDERLGAELVQALNDRKPAKEALRSAAQAWEKISRALGAADQLREYRQSLGLSVPLDSHPALSPSSANRREP